MTLTVAAVQLCQASRNTETSLRKALSYIEVAAQARAQLVVLPELFRTGYLFESYEDALPFAEPCHGNTFCSVLGVAKRLQVTVVYGYMELE